LQLIKNGKTIRLRTRNDLKPQIDVERIEAQAKEINAKQAIIDGEGAAVGTDGRTSWEALERRDSTYTIVLFAFDLLYRDGRDLLSLPLWQRQEFLANVVEDSGLQLCIALPGTLRAITKSVVTMGFEGLVAKNRDSPYQPDRRSFDWQKKAFTTRQEFVIGGYRPDGSDRVDSLLIGVYERSELVFVSKVRAGLDKSNRGPIRKALQPFNTSRCPFANLPTSERRGTSSWDSGGVSKDEMIVRGTRSCRSHRDRDQRFCRFPSDWLVGPI
jgi:bifunctional non-homologous end joining protein LigD